MAILSKGQRYFKGRALFQNKSVISKGERYFKGRALFEPKDI